MLCFMLFWQVSTKTSTDLTHIDIFYAILTSFNKKHPNSTHINIFHAILISFNKKIQIWHILIYSMLVWQVSTKKHKFDKYWCISCYFDSFQQKQTYLIHNWHISCCHDHLQQNLTQVWRKLAYFILIWPSSANCSPNLISVDVIHTVMTTMILLQHILDQTWDV